MRRLFCCCGHGFVAVHDLVLWSLFADGRVSFWRIFYRVGLFGRGRTDRARQIFAVGIAAVCASPRLATGAKILFFCAWGRALDSVDDGLSIISARPAETAGDTASVLSNRFLTMEY